MKEILITNDDGFDAAGILALQEALSPLGRVCVVAPAREKSACGHGLSITKPLSLISVGKDSYKLDDGTPADCIYLAYNTLYKEQNRKPDLIVSGINIGCNMGEDITYSGTAAGAMEGAILGVPSMAISQLLKKESDRKCDFSLAKKVAFDLAQKILTHNPLPKRKFLNVNIPIATESKGYKITELGVRLYGNDVAKARNPRNEEYYWLGTHELEWEERSERASDFSAVMSGYVSITPITIDMTSYDDLDMLAKWIDRF